MADATTKTSNEPASLDEFLDALAERQTDFERRVLDLWPRPRLRSTDFDSLKWPGVMD